METQLPTEQHLLTETLKELQHTVYNLLLQKKRGEATEEIVKHIENNNHIYTIRNDEKEEIWIYEKGIYLPNGKTYIEEICRNVLEDTYTTHIKNDVKIKIMADTYIDQEKFFNKQNEYINIIPVQNGLLNIESKKLNPFSPEYFFFNKLPVSYTPGQECPFIIQFFRDILEDEEDILTMQELFGFALLKEYRYEKAFMFLGNGRNGKGKTIEIMKRFLGVENCANISLTAIEKDYFCLEELQHKLVNISGDISNQALNHTGEFKALTGRDMIHAARKFKTRVKFENYAKMIFAANELPKSNDLTEAFFQRWEIINFPYTFYNTIDYEIHKNEKHSKLRNPNIIQEILSDEELSGLLNWSLEGLERLQEKKIFSCTKTSEEIRKTWIRKSDSASSFVEEIIIDDIEEGSFLTWGYIKMIYKNYCATNNLKPRTDKELRKSLIDNTLARATRRMVGDNQARGYEGIKIRDKKEKQVNIK